MRRLGTVHPTNAWCSYPMSESFRRLVPPSVLTSEPSSMIRSANFSRSADRARFRGRDPNPAELAARDGLHRDHRRSIVLDITGSTATLIANKHFIEFQHP